MDEIFDTILKLYGKPGIDTSYLSKLIRNKASSLEAVCWEFKGRFVKIANLEDLGSDALGRNDRKGE